MNIHVPKLEFRNEGLTCSHARKDASMKRLLMVSAIAFYCSSYAAAEQTYALRYRFQPGETLRWNVEHRTAVRNSVSNQTQTAETDTRSVKAWRVRRVQPDGSAVFEIVIESVDMRNRLAGCDEVRYNSKTDKKPPPGFEGAPAAVDVPLSLITLDSRGKVLHREVKLQSAVNPGISEITFPLPEKPIALGESWSQPCDLDVPLRTGGMQKIKALQRFTLEGVKTGVATIRVATQILTPVTNPEIEAQVVQHQSSGVIRFDIDAGRILSQQLDVDRHVVGYQGGASSLHYQMRFREEFSPESVRTAATGPAQR
jgi:hypothetical protein